MESTTKGVAYFTHCLEEELTRDQRLRCCNLPLGCVLVPARAARTKALGLTAECLHPFSLLIRKHGGLSYRSCLLFFPFYFLYVGAGGRIIPSVYERRETGPSIFFPCKTLLNLRISSGSLTAWLLRSAVCSMKVSWSQALNPAAQRLIILLLCPGVILSGPP